ncbi:MAG: hypothetical protein KKE51_09200 [Gammaproteobacteria bacterium]|nr:hypothetical protein [Gammaproteobacteria bacterium]MBU1602568.1 hypothetical protein [Gammaproteobacteria bacterium]MBU2433373.1 hypothetical protein [Gammaproteobacteria bacterium]MBU2451289.1 hypothetical protein [Gammaproteobacteria bacterium]
MDKQNQSDIAAFPDMFDGLEQFIEEQASGLKRTSAILAVTAMGGGMLIFYALSKIA